MICEHKDTTVTNSRISGHSKVANPPFPYLVYRRRKCLKCGEGFNTYEVTLVAIETHTGKWLQRYQAAISSVKNTLAGFAP